MHRVKTYENFLSTDEINYLLNFAKSIDKWESGGGMGFWDNRSLNAITIYNQYSKEVGQFLYDLRNRVSDAIKEMYVLGDQVYPDLFQIVRWFPGQEQPPHADDMTNSSQEGLDWYHHRHFGSVIYLNNDYSGGHTYYPQYNLDIKPIPGTLAVHPGDTDHMHGVTKIENSIRYTIASFWTFDKEYFDGWTIS